MTKEALRLALEAFNNLAAWNDGEVGGHMDEPYSAEVAREAITAIKEALANEALDKMAENARELGLDYEPEQPKVRTGNCLRVGVCASEGHKIQPQRTWVGLTDEEIDEWTPEIHVVIRAIEAKLKEKNNG